MRGELVGSGSEYPQAPQSIDTSGSLPIVVGLIGHGPSTSFLPQLHAREAAAFGSELVYHAFDIEALQPRYRNFADLLRNLEIDGYVGLKVTFPYRFMAMQHIDVLCNTARTVGSINTIVFREGRRFGHNTDCYGFEESFRRDLPDVPHYSVLLLGAGASGSAVGLALLRSGVQRLVIGDLDYRRAETLATRLSVQHGDRVIQVVEDPETVLASVDGVVNTTALGTADEPGSPLDARVLNDRLWVADINAVVGETLLLKTARDIGCRVMSGRSMAIFQAGKSFEQLTGLTPDLDRMAAAFDSFLV